MWSAVQRLHSGLPKKQLLSVVSVYQLGRGPDPRYRMFLLRFEGSYIAGASPSILPQSGGLLCMRACCRIYTLALGSNATF